MPAAKELVDAVGDVEIGVLGHAEEPLGRLDPFDTEGLAVSLRGVLDGRAVADVAVHEDQAWAARFRPGRCASARATESEVVGVGHGGHVPPVGDEAGGDVLGEGNVGVALDGDPVGVVDPAQVGEAPGARPARRPPRRCPPSCSRRRPGRKRRSRRPCGRPGCSAGRASARRSPYRRKWRPPGRAARWWSRPRSSSGTRDGPGSANRAGGSSSGRRGSPRRGRAPRSRGRPPGPRSGAGATTSRVEAWPSESTKRSRFGQIGSARVEAQEALPQRVGNRRHPHRRARVAGVRLLDGVHA